MIGQPPAVHGVALASTIGPTDAGIVPALLGAFKARTGLSVALTWAGTNRPLDLARGGGFDTAIVHAPALERRLIAEGSGLSCHELTANDAVVVGPDGDPLLLNVISVLPVNPAVVSRGSTESLSHAPCTLPEESC